MDPEEFQEEYDFPFEFGKDDDDAGDAGDDGKEKKPDFVDDPLNDKDRQEFNMPDDDDDDDNDNDNDDAGDSGKEKKPDSDDSKKGDDDDDAGDSGDAGKEKTPEEVDTDKLLENEFKEPVVDPLKDKDIKWKDLSPVLGFEAETAEDVQKKINELVETKVEEVKKTLPLTENIPEQARKVFEFFQNKPDATPEEFLEPTREYKALLQKDDETLVKEAYLANGRTEDEALDAVATHADKGDLDKVAQNIRAKVTEHINNVENELVENARKYQEQLREKVSMDIKMEDQMFEQTLEKVDNLFGVKLGPNTKKAMLDNWKAGDIRQKFEKDPMLAVKAVAFELFGEKILQQIKSQEYEKGLNSRVKKTFQTADKGAPGANRGAQDGPGASDEEIAEDPFADFKRLSQSQEGIEIDYN